MLSRERLLQALSFQPPDVIPLQIHPSPGGLYEHGGKLLDLMKRCGHDFGDLDGWALPEPPPPQDYDPDGHYHAFKRDEWGTTWEYRLFGIWGHPVAWPLNDLSNLRNWAPPAPAPCEGPEFDAAKAAADAHRRKYFLIGYGGSLFEKMYSLRRFEDVLMDIQMDTPEINQIADKLMENTQANVRRALALEVDAVFFGDDFGTQKALLLPPEVWRRFFKPRYKTLFEPVRKAGKHVFFHSCGSIGKLLEDFSEIGVTGIWPQLTAFEPAELAKHCRELGIALQLHPDRGDLMQRNTPAEVRSGVRKLLDIFDASHGGSWLYIEIDPGFPFENAQALIETAMELRKQV